MNEQERAQALHAWRLQNPHATQLPEWATRKREPIAQDVCKLYTITKRTAKWATVQVFAVEAGELRYRGTAKYQPGATRGHDWECRKVGHPFASDEKWPVVEIDANELA